MRNYSKWQKLDCFSCNSIYYVLSVYLYERDSYPLSFKKLKTKGTPIPNTQNPNPLNEVRVKPKLLSRYKFSRRLWTMQSTYTYSMSHYFVTFSKNPFPFIPPCDGSYSMDGDSREWMQYSIRYVEGLIHANEVFWREWNRK